jgi:hypothetical protein
MAARELANGHAALRGSQVIVCWIVVAYTCVCVAESRESAAAPHGGQGVIKRCRPPLLTNSALVIRVQLRGEGRSCGVSANEYSCAEFTSRDVEPK